MSAALVWLLVVVVVTTGLYLYWDDHPAVRLKRQIKDKLRREQQAQEELDAAHHRARTDMEQLADRWDDKP